MASRTLVKNYLAQWMQMGKSITLSNHGEKVSIHKILQGEKYSDQFNQLWDEISTTKAEEAHLSGTDQSISDLLSNNWEIIGCARCNLLVPSLDLGARVPVCCPCDDLPNHPNLDLVAPHHPTTLVDRLDQLCDRLAEKSTDQGSNTFESDQGDAYNSQAEDAQIIKELRHTMLRLVRASPASPDQRSQ